MSWQPTPVLLTVDVVARRGDRVLLVRRGNEPFAGCWALPGGFVDAGEPLEGAAVRELAEETGLVLDRADLRQVAAYGDPGRDPRRGRVVTVAYAVEVSAEVAAAQAVAGADDAAHAEWVDPAAACAEGLAFDHDRILADALALLG